MIDYDHGLPERMHSLPRDPHGRPVPWFVEWINGKPDFRIADGRKLVQAVSSKLCWACGKPLGRYKAFLIGPMCAVNRNTAEPPCHHDCAIYCATHCDFLVNPKRGRRELNETLAEQAVEPGGEMIKRNPGVSLVWVTREYKTILDEKKQLLFRLGNPTSTYWFAEGRNATRDEILYSIKTGLPILEEMAVAEGPEASIQLAKQVHEAFELIPA